MQDYRHFLTRISEHYYDKPGSAGMTLLLLETDQAVTLGQLSRDEQNRLIGAWYERPGKLIAGQVPRHHSAN
jgi:hypothetical protein